jgi:hypothetical protein
MSCNVHNLIVHARDALPCPMPINSRCDLVPGGRA